MFGFSRNGESQKIQTCEICKANVCINKQPYFKHSTNCKRVYCIWCTYNKLTEEKIKFNEKNKNGTTNKMQYKTYFTCCSNYDYFIYNAQKFFKLNDCVICGKNCKDKDKVPVQSELMIGKKCYQKLKNQSKLDKRQQYLLDKIHQYVLIRCQYCQQINVNSLIGEGKLFQKNLCSQKCLKQTKKIQQQKIKAEQQKIKKFCFNCKQQQIQGHIKIIEGEDKKNYCYFCYYQRQRNDALSKRCEGKITRKQYLNKLLKLQQQYANNCLICGLKHEKTAKIYSLPKFDQNDVQKFTCGNCTRFPWQQWDRYKNIIQFKVFFCQNYKNLLLKDQNINNLTMQLYKKKINQYQWISKGSFESQYSQKNIYILNKQISKISTQQQIQINKFAAGKNKSIDKEQKYQGITVEPLNMNGIKHNSEKIINKKQENQQNQSIKIQINKLTEQKNKYVINKQINNNKQQYISPKIPQSIVQINKSKLTIKNDFLLDSKSRILLSISPQKQYSKSDIPKQTQNNITNKNLQQNKQKVSIISVKKIQVQNKSDNENKNVDNSIQQFNKAILKGKKMEKCKANSCENQIQFLYFNKFCQKCAKLYLLGQINI